MFLFYLIQFIDVATQLLVLLIIVSVVLSYFMSPYHVIRENIDRIVEPMLAPVRRVVPLIGMIDFSPLVLIILIQVLSSALRNFLFAFLR
jgi:YggT family protein